MSSAPPQLVAINHDDHHAEHIGRTADGRQFFLTSPFVPASGDEAGREFIALFLFDPRGRFLDARIDDLGPRAGLDLDAAKRLHVQRLAELGSVTYERIEVQPFEVERFGTTFGLEELPSPSGNTAKIASSTIFQSLETPTSRTCKSRIN